MSVYTFHNIIVITVAILAQAFSAFVRGTSTARISPTSPPSLPSSYLEKMPLTRSPSCDSIASCDTTTTSAPRATNYSILMEKLDAGAGVGKSIAPALRSGMNPVMQKSALERLTSLFNEAVADPAKRKKFAAAARRELEKAREDVVCRVTAAAALEVEGVGTFQENAALIRSAVREIGTTGGKLHSAGTKTPFVFLVSAKAEAELAEAVKDFREAVEKNSLYSSLTSEQKDLVAQEQVQLMNGTRKVTERTASRSAKFRSSGFNFAESPKSSSADTSAETTSRATPAAASASHAAGANSLVSKPASGDKSLVSKVSKPASGGKSKPRSLSLADFGAAVRAHM